jgi:hypothetical protein
MEELSSGLLKSAVKLRTTRQYNNKKHNKCNSKKLRDLSCRGKLDYTSFK